MPAEQPNENYGEKPVALTETIPKEHMTEAPVSKKLEFKEVLERARAKGIKLDYTNPYTLRYFYEDEKLSTYEMAELFGRTNVTIWYWLRKHGIKRRTLSEACETHTKKPFSGDPVEKWGMLGLCASDIHVHRLHKGGNTVECSTTSTHPAELELVEKVWSEYGHCHKTPVFNPDTGQYEYGVYVLLDAKSFAFLEGKPTEAPKGGLFWPFLANLGIADGCWGIYKSHDNNIVTGFLLESTNYDLLSQVNEGLKEYGYHPNFRLARKAGTVTKRGVRSTKDYYGVYLTRRCEVVSLAERLLLYTKHREKVAWIKLILEIKDEKYWADVKDRVMTLREKIDRETKECVKEAEEAYKASHGGRDWFEVHSHLKSNDEVIWERTLP